MENLLTANQLAQRLKVSPVTVQRWSRDGRIPCLKLTAKVVRFDYEAVCAALREIGAKPAPPLPSDDAFKYCPPAPEPAP